MLLSVGPFHARGNLGVHSFIETASDTHLQRQTDQCVCVVEYSTEIQLGLNLPMDLGSKITFVESNFRSNIFLSEMNNDNEVTIMIYFIL